MLNPELKLNPKIFESDVEEKPIRDGYGEALMELGEKNPNIVVLTADLAESTRVHKFAEKWPERFIECGIAEQNMAGIAAGLAVSGKIPFISSYATFSPGKNWETIRTTIVYNEANVKIAGHHAGIVTGPDGATHQATEDIAIMRCLPNIKIISPCDAIEARKATLYAAEIYGPVYIRFVRDKTPVITTEETPFRFGKIEYFWVPRINADSERIDADLERTDVDNKDDGKLLFEDLTYKLRGCVFKVYNTIGKGHKESVYKKALEEEFKKQGLVYKSEPKIDVTYEDKLVGVYRPDFIIEDKIILEIKVKDFLTNEDEFQVYSYLKATKYKLSLLINFGFKKLEIKRILNTKLNTNPHESLSYPNKSVGINPHESISYSHKSAGIDPHESVQYPHKSVVAIFATGHLVYQALLAAKELEEEGINTYVLNVHTIKPLDIETIFEVASKVKGIVTVEDHQVAGGMGSAIAEVLVQPRINTDSKRINADKNIPRINADKNIPRINADSERMDADYINEKNQHLSVQNPHRSVVPPMIFIGLQDTFGESGSMKDLLRKYKMDKEAIKEAVKRLIEL
jgi:GxxExxY protein